MANKVLTFVIDTAEADLDHVLAAAVNELHSAGHTVRQVRITTDAGETQVPVNTIAGVTVPEPVVPGASPTSGPATDSATPATPTTQPEQAPPDGDETPATVQEPPVDTPPEPTPVESQ